MYTAVVYMYFTYIFLIFILLHFFLVSLRVFNYFPICVWAVQLSKSMVLPQGPLVYGDTDLDICRSDSIMYFPRYFCFN